MNSAVQALVDSFIEPIIGFVVSALGLVSGSLEA